MRVRYFVAPDLLEHLYRGLADHCVGRLIDQLLRADLILIDDLGFTPLDITGGQLQWSEFLPQQETAVALLDRLHYTRGSSRGRWSTAHNLID